MITIKNMDALDYLKTIPDESVDLVLTDPPYGIGYDGGKKWDSQWDTEQDYLDWCEQWSKECIRVLKPGRMMVVWGTLKTDTFLKYKLLLSEQPEMVSQNEIIWSYNWGGRSKKNFARKHEYAWCYSKGKEHIFNADDIRVERKVAKNIRTGELHTQGTIPTSVWERNNHTGSKEFVRWHPTPKNIQILERIIKAYTNAGDTVLDIFMGSGNTAVASANTGRNAIGCELSQEYYDLMQERFTELGIS